MGITDPAAEKNPLLNGVGEMFGTTDVYEAYPPEDATILVRGLVLNGMEKNSKPAEGEKSRSTDKTVQKLNGPVMSIAWSREVKNEAGKINRVMTTTMGAATDFLDENLRRLVVNSVFWGLGIDVPAKADVTIAGEYSPTNFGFGGGKKGVKAADLQ